MRFSKNWPSWWLVKLKNQFIPLRKKRSGRMINSRALCQALTYISMIDGPCLNLIKVYWLHTDTTVGVPAECKDKYTFMQAVACFNPFSRDYNAQYFPNSEANLGKILDSWETLQVGLPQNIFISFTNYCTIKPTLLEAAQCWRMMPILWNSLWLHTVICHSYVYLYF